MSLLNHNLTSYVAYEVLRRYFKSAYVSGILQIIYKFIGRILKVNLSWSPTWAKFCQLIEVYPWFNPN